MIWTRYQCPIHMMNIYYERSFYMLIVNYRYAVIRMPYAINMLFYLRAVIDILSNSKCSQRNILATASLCPRAINTLRICYWHALDMLSMSGRPLLYYLFCSTWNCSLGLARLWPVKLWKIGKLWQITPICIAILMFTYASFDAVYNRLADVKIPHCVVCVFFAFSAPRWDYLWIL